MKQFKAVISALKKQVREESVAREFRNRGEQERQVQSLQARYDEQLGIVQKLQSENVCLTGKIEDSSDLMRKYEELLAVNCRLKEELQNLEERFDVLRATLRTGGDENSRLKAKISQLEQAANQASRGRIEREILLTKLTDARNRNLTLKTDCQTAIQRSDHVNRQRIACEAKFAKLRDQTTGLTARFGVLDDEAMNLQRFAFLLADALGESFDPKLGEQELQRLLSIARECRVTVGGRPCKKTHRLDHSGTIAKEFDSIEREISALYVVT
jgi:chromosome segregation ATPase